jgi:hypothetical protein
MANKETRGSITSGASEAKVLLVTALEDLRKTVTTVTAEAITATDKFFPNGIELISIKVEISGVAVELKVAGEKGIKGLLGSGPNSDEGETTVAG